MSQWTTLESGPLAAGEGSEIEPKARKCVSQWSTLESGPLAPWEVAETGTKARKRREPVVHFVEWTTSSPGGGRNQHRGLKTATTPTPFPTIATPYNPS